MSGATSSESNVQALLAAAASDMRHPAMLLSCFTSEVLDDDQVVDDVDGIDDLSPAVPAQMRRDAELRRAALVVASVHVVERCLDDLAELSFGEDTLPVPEDAEDSLVYDAFPPRHRRAYDRLFFRKVLVTAVKVSQDLADPHGGPPACTAEEILRSYIGELALQLCVDAGLGEPALHPDELLLEDTDFENLFDDAMDGLENDPAHQAAIHVEVPAVADWFTPFNNDRVVHPYARTEPSGELELHDLHGRLAMLSPQEHEKVDWSGTDDPAPISSLAAISEVVELARRAAGQSSERIWMPNPSDPENSFDDLVRLATLSDGGSGWLTWEPHADADTVRTDGVVSLEPHRHYPVGDDEPWAKVSLGGRFMAVPLSAVVSYEPDPEPRRRWNYAFSSLA